MKPLTDYAFNAFLIIVCIMIYILVHTWESHDKYLQPQHPPQRELTPAEVGQLNDLGSHDRDEDIQWTYNKEAENGQH